MNNVTSRPASIQPKWKFIDIFSMVCVVFLILLTWAPLSGIYLQSNDDIRWANEIREGGLTAVAKSYWYLSIVQQRLHIGKLFSYTIPFLIEQSWWFDLFKILPVILAWPLFGWVLRKSGCSPLASWSASLIGLAWQTNTFDLSPLAFSPGMYSWLVVWFLLGTLSFLAAMERQLFFPLSLGRYCLAGLLWGIPLLGSEAFYPFLWAVVLIPFLKKDRPKSEAMKFAIFPLLIGLICFLCYGWLRLTNPAAPYAGAVVSHKLNLPAILNVYWKFTSWALPWVPVHLEKYRFLFDYYKSGSPFQPQWLCRAFVVGWLLIYGMVRFSSSDKSVKRRRLIPVLFSLLFLSSLLPALTDFYQEAVRSGWLAGYVTSWYALFAWAALFSTGFAWMMQKASLPAAKILLGAFMTAWVVWGAWQADYVSAAVRPAQIETSRKILCGESLAGSPFFKNMPAGSIITAPNLFESVGSMGFNMAYYEPTITPERRIDYWSYLLNRFRTNGAIRVVQSFSQGTNFYLKYLPPAHPIRPGPCFLLAEVRWDAQKQKLLCSRTWVITEPRSGSNGIHSIPAFDKAGQKVQGPLVDRGLEWYRQDYAAPFDGVEKLHNFDGFVEERLRE